MVVLAAPLVVVCRAWRAARRGAYGVVMTTAAAWRSRAAPPPARWLRRIVRDTTFVIAGVPVQLAALAVVALPWVTPWFVVISGRQAIAALLASAALLLAVRVPLTAIQGHRLWSVLGADVRPARVAPGQPPLARLAATLRSGTAWRQLGYHVLAGPVLAMGGLLTLAAWAAGAGLAASYLYDSVFPPLSRIRAVNPKTTVLLTVAGAGLLLLAPAVAAAVTWLDLRAARVLLGPSRSEQLERQVESLAQSRAGVLDAADAERRRIERDLHDGAQQRLVSLAMNLGLARANLTELPDPARQVIAEAHEEAKEALAELRNLVRGLHPAVLDDRGLDAALSGIAARAPLPVTLAVDVPERAAPTVEAVAYFVVSECLTNIARHSRASRAEIDVRRTGDILRIRVTDDGTGGADPARGSGLASLSQRARSVDGILHLDSPAGGPTVITVELPCAL
jgi:signal transduction histidine kinase